MPQAVNLTVASLPRWRIVPGAMIVQLFPDGSPRHGSPRHGSPRHGSPRHGSPLWRIATPRAISCHACARSFTRVWFYFGKRGVYPQNAVSLAAGVSLARPNRAFSAVLATLTGKVIRTLNLQFAIFSVSRLKMVDNLLPY